MDGDIRSEARTVSRYAKPSAWPTQGPARSARVAHIEITSPKKRVPHLRDGIIAAKVGHSRNARTVLLEGTALAVAKSRPEAATALP